MSRCIRGAATADGYTLAKKPTLRCTMDLKGSSRDEITNESLTKGVGRDYYLSRGITFHEHWKTAFKRDDLSRIAQESALGFEGESAFEDVSCRLAGAPANRDLVMLDAFLVDAENADIGGMVTSAGIDAAGNIQAQRADLDASRGIFKPFEYPVRHRQGPGARKIAVIKTRTGDHVTDQAFLGTAQARDCQTFTPPLISKLSQHHPGVPGM